MFEIARYTTIMGYVIYKRGTAVFLSDAFAHLCHRKEKTDMFGIAKFSRDISLISPMSVPGMFCRQRFVSLKDDFLAP